VKGQIVAYTNVSVQGDAKGAAMMEKVSIWKRMGGWLRWSQTSKDGLEVVHHNAEGLVVDPSVDKDGNENSLVTREEKREQQLAAMEESFHRLVEVLESLDDNVAKQRQHTEELCERMGKMGEVLGGLPGNVAAHNKTFQELTQEMKEQAVRHKQVIETVKTLPDLNRQQVDRLEEIVRQVENSSENEARMTDSFNRFDNSLQGVLNNSKSQAQSLTNIGEMLGQNESRLQELVRRQGKRFSWLLVIVLIVALAAIGGLAAIVYMSI